MIRFIDLRNQDIPYNFAFFDTITDRFISIRGDMVWDNWLDVEGSTGFEEEIDLSRLKGLCPPWVFELEKY